MDLEVTKEQLATLARILSDYNDCGGCACNDCNEEGWQSSNLKEIRARIESKLQELQVKWW